MRRSRTIIAPPQSFRLQVVFRALGDVKLPSRFTVSFAAPLVVVPALESVADGWEWRLN